MPPNLYCPTFRVTIKSYPKFLSCHGSVEMSAVGLGNFIMRPIARPSATAVHSSHIHRHRCLPAACLAALLSLISLPALAQVAVEPQASEVLRDGNVSFTPSDDRQGTFKAVRGEVTVIRADVRSAAVVGNGFSGADRLVTGAKSAAALTLQDGTMLSIGPDSALDLEKFAYDPTTQTGNIAVRLLRGSLRMITGLIAKLKPEEVTVKTPTAVIGVRGTDFIVEAKAP